MIESKKYFYYDYCSNFGSGDCVIRINVDSLPPLHTDGSLNVLPARVMGLSYAQYLRMCRDLLGARLEGKGHKYPIAIFTQGEGLNLFLKLLNNRMDCIMRAINLEKKKKGEDANVVQIDEERPN